MARKLHIGGKIVSPGWEILDVLPGPDVDHVANANDLSQFPDCTFNDVYASHVLEHFDYNGAILDTLKEWNRVLKPYGRLYVSVPDMDILARLLLEKEKLSVDERYHVMRIMFGGHMDQYDYHLAGLNEDFLSILLAKAGFVSITRVESFGLFDDSSCMRFKNELISLNMTAKKGSVS